MRQTEKKYFGDIQSGRLNADDSPFALTTNEWVNAKNVRTGTTDNGFTGIVESVGGNTMIDSPVPIYNEIQIGTQTWMGKDLDVTKYANGDDILYIEDATNWTNAKQGAWCWYNNDPATGRKLYNWYAVNDERGLAPSGWRVATTSDFNTLSSTISGQGGFLKQTGFTNWNTPNTGANNAYNFNATGNGYRGATGTFSGLKANTYYWTSNVSASPAVYILSYNADTLTSSTNALLQVGYSIRCVKIPTTTDYTTIGTVEDTENNRILYFNYDAYGNHYIGCLYTNTNTNYYVLLNSQVVGGLNFNLYSLIHSAKISGNILSWVDATQNEPRKINIESALRANYSDFSSSENVYEFPLNFSEVTVIKRPPAFTPNTVKTIDNSFPNNFIQFDSFEFAFQYQYWDNETTVVGSYSQTSKLNFPDEKNNSIVVNLDIQEKIPSTVRIVSLVVRYGNGKPGGSTNASVVKKWDKKIAADLSLIKLHNNGTSTLQYVFYNNLSGNSIPEDDVLRPFDNVPIYSQTHEVAKNKYFFANNTEGYETPKESSLYVKLGQQTTLTASVYQVQMWYLKFGHYAGTLGTKKTWSTFGLYVYIPGMNTPTISIREGYYLLNLTGNYAFQSNLGTANVYPSGTFPLPASGQPTTVNISQCVYKGRSINEVLSNTRPATGFNFNYDNSEYQFYSTRYCDIQEQIDFGAVSLEGVNNDNHNYNVLPNNALYKYGVVFYDYAMRKCGVCDKSNNAYAEVFNQTVLVKNSTSRQAGLNTLYLKFGSPYSAPAGTIIVGDKIVISSGANLGTYIIANILNYYISGGYTYYELRLANARIDSQPTYTASSISVQRIRSLELKAPSRDYIYSTAYQNSNWYLENTNALTEIPDWAYYYSVVRTLNLKTRFYIQSFSNALKYVRKDSNGVFIYDNNYSANAVGIGIHTGAILYSGLGYTFTPKDMCVLWNSSGGKFELPVIGQDGNYIHIKNANIGVLNTSTNTKFTFEIYTPYQEQIDEPYYEIGEIYSVLNPKSSNRIYSVTNGTVGSDSFAFTRAYLSNNYIAGAMSPNDLFWKNYDTDSGKVNVVTTLSQSIKNQSISWSDNYISGTEINGSSTFRLGNETSVSDDCGSINKLQLTSKVQDQGTVMLSLCSAEINSMYLGETQITDSTGKVQFFTSSQNVISTINTLKGNYGCINPESVIQYRGRVYFVDANNGRVVQYSENGLDNISAIKMSRFWKNYLQKYNSLTKQQIVDSFGDRPFIFSMIDPYHDELLISIPTIDYAPKGYLPDYQNVIYPFDIMDYQGKTVVYKLGTGAVVVPHWQGVFTFKPEYFAAVENKLYSFKDGTPWLHNAITQNQFYAADYTSDIMFTSNILPQIPKVYDNFVSESNIVPNFVYFYNKYPYLQTSDLNSISFKSVEGIWYANILRNKIVPTGSGTFTTDGLLTQEVMRNNNMYVWVRFQPSGTPLQLNLLQLGMSISKGHTV